MQAFDEENGAQAVSCLSGLAQQYTYLDPIMNVATENGFQVGQRSYISLGVNLAEANGTYYALLKEYDMALGLLAQANVSEGLIPYNEPPVYTRPVLATYANVLFRLWNSSSDSQYLLDAVEIYTEIIHSPWHNNSGFGWYGIGYSYATLGNVTAAKAAFSYFLDVTWASADPTLPQVIYARQYLASHGSSTTTSGVGDSMHRTATTGMLCFLFVLYLLYLNK